jgi:hypothetical protein
MKRHAKLLFHSPCFDGIVSAVLVLDYLQHHEQWGEVECVRVNYDHRDAWLATRFTERTAVVDFLYHPDAVFWADHHRSAFLTAEMRTDFLERNDAAALIYDPDFDSCAGLLWCHLAEYASYRNDRFAELVRWAEKIDAARYDSVDEALSFSHPALQISASLALGSDGYSESLVHLLSARSLEEVSETPEVRAKFVQFQRSTIEGLTRLGASARLRDDVVVFDVDAREAIVPRYAPYRFFPHARYSVGVIRYDDGAKITAMRNPWRNFESVPLGDIFTRYGGGGHQRVASAFVPAGVDPHVRLEEILNAVAAADRDSHLFERR